MAGVYSYLPLGLKVLNKIQNIIRDEMNMIGGQELVMTSLQEKEAWEKTGRWNDKDMDVWFKTQLKNGTELGLAATHEEPITKIAKQYVQSYADLPFSAYQFQTKFRNETRAKSGIMRTREFVMKDLYSFHVDESDLNNYYERAAVAYKNVFERVGIGSKTFKTFASGGVFSKYSHEFQTLCEAGEDIIYLDEEKQIAVNKEVYTDEVLTDLGLSKDRLVERKAIEVGNIFKLNTKFSKPLELNYKDENGENHPVIMGTYGIGPGRLMGTVVELLADDKGLVWPKEISPFQVHLVRLGNSEEVIKKADELYKILREKSIEVLYDDRDARPGEKFADSDLLGMPIRLVISEKTLELGKDSNDYKIEVKYRTSDNVDFMSEKEVLNILS
jgi:prolyl-tRNA synthetase